MTLAALRKLFYGQQLFTALRLTAGITLPTLIFIVLLDEQLAGLACAVGAICVGVIDQPNTLKAKYHEMLSCSLAVILAASFTLYAQTLPSLLFIAVLLISFGGGLLWAFGQTASYIGQGMYLVMALSSTLDGLSLPDRLTFLAGLSCGVLWYTAFSLFICSFLRHQYQRRALAESLFATAAYLATRARCYDPNEPEQTAHEALLNRLVAVQQAQQQARNLVFNDIASRQEAHPLNPNYIRLFNLFIDVVDLHDLVLSSYTDFELLRRHFQHSHSLIFLRDALNKMAQEVDKMAAAIAHNTPYQPYFNAEAELRALSLDLQEIEHTAADEVITAFTSSIDTAKQLSLLVEKMHADLSSQQNSSNLSLQEVIKRFSTRPALLNPPTQTTWASALAYAARLTLAMLIALWASQQLGNAHGSWILLTVAVAMRPGFGQSHQRGWMRLKGTLLGCGAAIVLVLALHNPYLLSILLILGLLLAYGLALHNYQLSVFFTSITAILTYNLLLPTDNSIVEARLLATVIGAAIALGAAYCFPFWEYAQIKPQINKLLAASLIYLDQTLALSPHTELDYRLARREMLTALTTLTTTYERMLLEPEKKRLAPALVHTLLLQGQAFASQVATLAKQIKNQPLTQQLDEITHALQEARMLLDKPISPAQEEALTATTNNHSVSKKLPLCTLRFKQLADQISGIR